jgi:hypothetical protein
MTPPVDSFRPDYWRPGTTIWEYWRKHFQLSKDEAIHRWQTSPLPVIRQRKGIYEACWSQT